MVPIVVMERSCGIWEVSHEHTNLNNIIFQLDIIGIPLVQIFFFMFIFYPNFKRVEKKKYINSNKTMDMMTT